MGHWHRGRCSCPAVTRAVREKVSCEELLEGVPTAGIRAALAGAERVLRKASERRGQIVGRVPSAGL